MPLRGFIFSLLCSLLWALPGQAEAPPDLRVEGNAVIFDTEQEGAEGAEIDDADIGVLLALLRENPAVRTLKLNSRGGLVWPGESLTEIIMDFELDTEVINICNSICTSLFLAGSNRRLPKGARLGFHQRSWKPASAENYFDDVAKKEGWATPFEFVSWLYRDTQDEMYRLLSFMIDRGVDPRFALETIRYRGDRIWYPGRAELKAAGVITSE